MNEMNQVYNVTTGAGMQSVLTDGYFVFIFVFHFAEVKINKILKYSKSILWQFDICTLGRGFCGCVLKT